jgi:hypothetical protein
VGRATVAWISFLLAAGEFEGLLHAAIVFYGWPIPSFFAFQELALPPAYLVGAAAAGVMFFIGRRQRRALAEAWTEPLDLETLRRRIAIPDRVAPEQPATKTRQLLDEVRDQRSARVNGIAGASRRRQV